ncbi:hypothetical protein [Nocardia beijingensis]|uniref:Uncharacterized protein n=1 Tax=Nocardia beijingensis TaxID=95162 RepID=A0ABW7WCE0_9NOCA
MDQFHVLKPDSKLACEKSSTPEYDGQPLTRFGNRLRAEIGKLSGIQLDDVPLGLIRVLEAASADDAYNIGQLGRIQITRTGSGIMHGALLRLHSPMVAPSVINGRILAQTQATMSKGGRVPILRAVDAGTLRLPRLVVDSADQVITQAEEARRLLGLADYRNDDREFIDDLLLKGVKEPPLVVPFLIDAADRGSGWLLQAVDGARRTTATHEILHNLGAGAAYKAAVHHWSDGRGGSAIRDMTAADVVSARQLLCFENAPLRGLFPLAAGRSVQDADRVAAWKRNVAAGSLAIRAAHRVRTYFAFVVLHVEAFAPADFPNPVWHVVNDAVRQRHMPKAAAKQWDPQDVWALYAIDVIDELGSRGAIDSVQQNALLNPAAVDLVDTMPVVGDRAYRNRLVAIAHFAALVCTGATVELTNAVLAKNQERIHSHERGQIVGAQARILLGLHNLADGASIAATITSICKHKVFYRLPCHPLPTKWPHVIAKSPDELLERAVHELYTQYNQDAADRADVGGYGPHQRALGLLGGIALVINPALRASDEHLTRTGRGGRGHRPGDISRQDPPILLQRMMETDEGLAQLAEVIRATTSPTPRIPRDRFGTELTETQLRTVFLPKLGEAPEELVQDWDDELDGLTAWGMMAEGLRTGIAGLANHVEQMRKLELKEGAVQGSVLQLQGLPSEDVDALRPQLSAVADFLTEAKVFGEFARRVPSFDGGEG